GLAQFPPRRYHIPFAYGLGVAMFLIALACPFLFIRPAYARPLVVAADRLDSVPNQVGVSYDDRMRLLGYELEGQVFRPGEAVYVTLYWQGLEEMEKDYSVSLVLLTPSGDLVGQEDSYPGLGSFPTSQWRVGKTIADRCWVRVRPRTQAPIIAWLGVNVYYLPTMERLPAEEDGQAVEQVRLARVKIVPWAAEEYTVSNTLLYNFGNQIELVGYDLGTGEVQPGEALELTLYWRARRQPDADYTVFVHLADYEGRIWAQDDGYPLRGDYPTSFWDRGEVVRDARELALPQDMPTGEYGLEVGLYLVPSMERLPVLDDGGRVLDNRIVLSTIAVLD
ncbi:MAG: hypothetical protein OEV76_08395, partial [Anaerolineae bacterium]|nr:hypothetical protein [Anaerolineae bacterium]